jgi:hypothetical protein
MHEDGGTVEQRAVDEVGVSVNPARISSTPPTSFYTAPTAIRTLMRFGDAWVRKHDLSSLRILGSVASCMKTVAPLSSGP